MTDREERNRYFLKKKQKYDARTKEFLARIKLYYGCQICGYKEHPSALTFDHIDPDTKALNLSNYGSHGWPAIIDEVSKCRVLCANCHNIHSSRQHDNGVQATPITKKVLELVKEKLPNIYKLFA